jgi:hypothetical protein
MSLKLNEKMNHPPLSDALNYDDEYGLIVQLNYLQRILKRGVIDFFLSFLIKYDERRAHNMQALMLDFKFNSLKLISFHGHN